MTSNFKSFELISIYDDHVLSSSNHNEITKAIEAFLVERFGMQHLVESYAEENNLPDSEDALSTMFDEDVLPHLTMRDEVAVTEAFNNWTDSLCKDGTIHEWQYENYTYVGEGRHG